MRLGMTGMAAMLVAATAGMAHGEQENGKPRSALCGAKTAMTSAEQIRELSAVKTPAELLQLLRRVHDNFLLLDSSFFDDANLLRLLSPGEVKQEWPYGKDDNTTWKRLIPSAESTLKGDFKINGTRASEYLAGRFYFGSVSQTPPYTAAMIEQYLVPDVQGRDPFAPGFEITNENMDAAGRRPRSTHPKGYFQYQQIKQARGCRSILFVRLHQNGTLRDIDLKQEEKK